MRWRRRCCSSAVARLSAITCPRSLDFREQLPREANGKLFKRRLREEYLSDGARG